MAGVAKKKILALDDHQSSELFDEREKAALAYADAITLSDKDVSDELFARLRRSFDDDDIGSVGVGYHDHSSP